jgi:outer membrane lipoprotein carrier protein LolA
LKFAAVPLILLALLSPGFAQQRTQPDVIGPHQTLRGHFVETRKLAGFARPLRSEGSFVLAPGKGLIWRSEKPFKNATIISNDGILQLVDGQEAMRLSSARLPGLSHLYEVLGAAVSGDTKPLQKAFTVKMSSDGDRWRLVLMPLHPDNPAMAQLKSLTVEGRRYVEEIDVDKGDGDLDQLAFSDEVAGSDVLTPEEDGMLKALRK